MKVYVRYLLALLTVCIAVSPAQQPARAFEMKNCAYCGRVWDDSPSRIRALADANGHDKDIYVCSPYCLCEVLKLKPHYKLLSAQVVLWPQRKDMQAMLMSVESARFLTGVKDEHDYSHDPDVAAFRTDKELASGKKDLGGTTTTWDKIMEKCKKLAADAEDEEEDSYQPLHNRKY